MPIKNSGDRYSVTKLIDEIEYWGGLVYYVIYYNYDKEGDRTCLIPRFIPIVARD
jgi:hypothetical protein